MKKMRIKLEMNSPKKYKIFIYPDGDYEEKIMQLLDDDSLQHDLVFHYSMYGNKLEYIRVDLQEK